MERDKKQEHPELRGSANPLHIRRFKRRNHGISKVISINNGRLFFLHVILKFSISVYVLKTEGHERGARGVVSLLN